MTNKDLTSSKEFISLHGLSKILNINKATLSYYVSVGLLRPQEVVSRMYLFNKKKTLKVLEEINRLKAEGKKLKEIKNSI